MHDPSFDHSRPATRALGVPLGNPKARRLNKRQKVTYEDMAKLIGYKMQEEFEFSELWGSWYADYLGDGLAEDEARERADKECEIEENRIMLAQHEAIKSAFEAMLEDHGLELQPMKKLRYVFRIQPKTTWLESAAEVLCTIHGVGLFQFESLSAFLRSGSYTHRQAVLEHLHWMKDYPRVYGDSEYKNRISFE